jgi:hypothetical protein
MRDRRVARICLIGADCLGLFRKGSPGEVANLQSDGVRLTRIGDQKLGVMARRHFMNGYA